MESPRAPEASSKPLAIGLDVGGTKIAGGVLDADGTIVATLSARPTPTDDQESTVAALVEAVAELRASHPSVVAVGVGTAGLVEWPSGYIRWAPNNPYKSLPLRELLEAECRLPAVVDNDANAAAWAQARVGHPALHLLFLTVGTGIGGGLILDGALYRGSTGLGAEVGHLALDPFGDRECGCGNNGCWEALASGNALGRYGREAAAGQPDGMLARLAGGPSRVTGETVYQAASEGDEVALELYQRVGTWLGIGIASLVALLDVEVVVVGGGVAEAGDLLLKPTRESFRHRLFARDHRHAPPIVAAELGTSAGWIGAGLLALEQRGLPMRLRIDLVQP